MKNGANAISKVATDGGHWGGNFRVAIVGAGTLKGRELKEILTDRNFPAHDIRLLDDDESLGQLDAVGEEPAFIQSVLPEHLENVDFAFFASDEGFTRNVWQSARKAGSDIIDLSYAVEGEPGALLRAPWVERELGVTPQVHFTEALVVIAHPAAVVLAMLMLRAQHAARIARAVATVFEPASEHGKRGMDELHEQTVNLLSFQQLPKNVFDAQVAFNMLDRYGGKSASSLGSVEGRIQRHFGSLVGERLPVPSLVLLHAPIFHGQAFSLNLEFERPVTVEEVEAALAGEHVQLLQTGEDAPSNVNAAGQEQIQVFARADVQNPKSLWLWAASDNLRVAALTAVECAEGMIAARPRGAVQ